MKKIKIFIIFTFFCFPLYGSNIARLLADPIIVIPVQMLYWPFVLAFGIAMKKKPLVGIIFVPLAFIGNMWNYSIYQSWEDPKIINFTGAVFFTFLSLTILMILYLIIPTKNKKIEQED